MIQQESPMEQARAVAVPAVALSLLRSGEARAVTPTNVFAISYAGPGDLPTGVSREAALQWLAQVIQ